ncbi:MULTISPECIES: metal-binding protein ZinT [Modicisalibacter]|uniref:ZinT family metal-binding protein n=1 Tax=Modicisalibacter TaxID=574347 RepID=UPI00100A6965|nr:MULTISPECIES: metal-binding protein ZinT [Halomonadaceae]MBZ9557077.1 metal-binding protein ZinT [Modicisalibacter sp. R2A 31.J]MBZ9574209.1 metal-binding protein ZinT [Modicisalibacter sp. MOD 31.J]
MQQGFKKALGLSAIGVLLMGIGQAVSASQDEAGHSANHDHGHDHGHAHEHNHGHDQDDAIRAGYFKDAQVEDRSLADWQGDWQSVYPYLKDGTLDPVFAHKAAHDAAKTAEAIKEYYATGYRTSVQRIEIDGDRVTFHEGDDVRSGTYAYDGYEILTYEAGNRGVRYVFERQDGAAAAPRFIQFSDHHIAPTDAGHYHLYWGDDRDALLDEVTNWPTYYPSAMSGDEIAHEMLAH